MIAADTWMTSQYRLQRRHQLRRLGVEHASPRGRASAAPAARRRCRGSGSSWRRSSTRNTPVTASAPVTENSNMLPHGARSADRPRVTTAPRCSRKASTVSATRDPARAGRRARAVARPRRRPSGAGARRRTSAAEPPRRPSRAMPRRRRLARRPSRAGRPERELGREAVHRERVDRHRGVEQVVAELRRASALAHVVLPSTARDLDPAPRARRPRRPAPRGPLPRCGPGPRPRPAYARRRPRDARTQTRRRRTNSDSIRPASASTAAASAGPVPGLRATCSVAHRRTPSKVIDEPVGQLIVAPGASDWASGWPPCPDLGQPGLSSRVDRLRGAVVEPEVAGPGGRGRPAEPRAPGNTEIGPALRVERRGRQEEALEAELVRLRARRLHHAGRGHAAVLRQERHRPAEDDLAGRVAHREHRRVAVAEQEHLGAVDHERVVDPQ